MNPVRRLCVWILCFDCATKFKFVNTMTPPAADSHNMTVLAYVQKSLICTFMPILYYMLNKTLEEYWR